MLKKKRKKKTILKNALEKKYVESWLSDEKIILNNKRNYEENCDVKCYFAQMFIL